MLQMLCHWISRPLPPPTSRIAVSPSQHTAHTELLDAIPRTVESGNGSSEDDAEITPYLEALPWKDHH